MTSYLKAIIPAAATIVAVFAQWAVTGAFDRAELATAIGGLLTAGLVYLAPNKDTELAAQSEATASMPNAPQLIFDAAQELAGGVTEEQRMAEGAS